MVQYDCYQCGRVTEHVTLAQAARRVQKNPKTIKFWVKNEWVAFQELPSGRIYICAECLLKAHGPGSHQSSSRRTS
jgi:hypothetical protein